MKAAVVPTTLASPIPIQPVAIGGAAPLHLLVFDNDRFVREACKEAAVALGYDTIAKRCPKNGWRPGETSSLVSLRLSICM